jgi:hypothetical protein
LKKGMPEPRRLTVRQRRAVRAGVVVGALLVAYSAFGFLVAPRILRNLIVEKASAALHRDVSVAKVRVNPLALSVTVEGLAVKHRDGHPFVGWQSLYVRVAPLRLLAGDIGVAEIRLVQPAVYVGLAADGALSFQDLLAPEAPAGGAPPPAPAPAGRPAPAKERAEDARAVSIGRLAVEEARVVFHDATVKPAFESALGPLTFRLEEFRTQGGKDSPYSFAGTTDAGETFRWSGTVRTQPLRSAGTLAFEQVKLSRYDAYLRKSVPVELRDGVLDLETRYEVEWGAERRVVRISGGKVAVERLALGPPGVAPSPVSLARLEVSGVEADVLARDAKVAEVALRDPALRVLREPDGRLELTRMVPPPAPRGGDGGGAPWTWSVGAFSISGGRVAFEDRTPPRPATLALTDVRVRLEQLRGAKDAASPLAVAATWAGEGRLEAKGTVRPLGSAATLDLEAADLDLVPLAPYLEPDVRARLAAGRAGAKARVEVDASGPAPRWTFRGDVRLDGLSVAEAGNEELLRWRTLEVTGVDAQSTPPRASVKRVRLAEPRLKVYLWEDGTTSLARALAPKAAPRSPGAPPPPAPPAAPAWRTDLGVVEVVGGRAAFVDRSLVPPVLVNVTRAEAKVTRLSSDPRVRSTVDVRVDVEGEPIRVAGTLNPLQTGAYTDVTVTSGGVDLTPLGPYAGKFLGYGLQKGKLDLDLRYKVEERALAGANVVKVNQLTLGDATNSPDATRIPVRLALALLQDQDGVILLDVPIEGNLDDPEFHFGKVIWRAIMNVLVKVATSPFRALAALAGGGDADLSLVEFVPGTSQLAPGAQDRFPLLAKSLARRPALSLELEGAADPELDGGALRRAALDRSLRRTKATALRPPPESIEEVRLAPEERAHLVRTAYDAAFPPAPARAGQAAPAAPTEKEMEDRLAAGAELPADALPALAAERARLAREALLAAGLDSARIFLSQGGDRAQKEKGARVYFTVR